MLSISETAESIVQSAKKRWLNPTEIFVLLSHEPEVTGLGLQTSPIMNPKGISHLHIMKLPPLLIFSIFALDGHVHIFEEQVFAQHKSSIDNVDWAK